LAISASLNAPISRFAGAPFDAAGRFGVFRM
jgi:hypothetical protein